MRVRFWGTGGSIATPGPGTNHFGGNTSCVELTTANGDLLIFDCGTQLKLLDLRKRMIELNLQPTVPFERLLASLNRIKPAPVPQDKLPEEFKASVRALKPETRRFHGVKLALSWFPFPGLISPCSDRFGYMSSAATWTATKLRFNVTTQALLGRSF